MLLASFVIAPMGTLTMLGLGLAVGGAASTAHGHVLRMMHCWTSWLLVCLAAPTSSAGEAPFPCHESPAPFIPGGVTAEDAAARKCCLDLPCEYSVGCWEGQMPPTYSAPRFQAISEEQARHLETTLLWPATKTMNKTFVHQFPDHGWYRVPVPQATHGYFYEGLHRAFQRLFSAEVIVTVDLDVFFVDDFDDSWSSDETYRSSEPGAS